MRRPFEVIQFTGVEKVGRLKRLDNQPYSDPISCEGRLLEGTRECRFFRRRRKKICRIIFWFYCHLFMIIFIPLSLRVGVRLANLEALFLTLDIHAGKIHELKPP